MGAESRVRHPPAAVTTLSPQQGVRSCSQRVASHFPFPSPGQSHHVHPESPEGPAAASAEGQPGCACAWGCRCQGCGQRAMLPVA